MKCNKMYIDNEYVCFELETGFVYEFSMKRLKNNPGGWIAQLRDKVWGDPKIETFLREITGFKGEAKHSGRL